jgi:hypothetical protein
LCFWHRSFPCDAFRQTLSFDKVHHQVSVAFFFEKIGHAYQIGMAEAGQDLSFLLELFAQLVQSLLIQTWLGNHLLDSTVNVEASVPGFVDRPHSALSQHGDDAIAIL